jgi:hypothetical protein
MKALICPTCGGPSDAPVSRMLRSDNKCVGCHKAARAKYNRDWWARKKQKEPIATRAPRWTAEEDEAIINGAKEIPGRTWDAVKTRRCHVRASFWHNRPYSDADRRFVLRHYKTKSYAWIGEQIGRPEYSVSSYLLRNGLGSGQKKGVKLHKLTDRQRERIPAEVQAAVPRTLPKIMRDEIVNMMIVAALERRLDFKAIRAAFKAYQTQYYVMYPDKGAHTSLDAEIYNDGPTTLGDTIESTALRF